MLGTGLGQIGMKIGQPFTPEELRASTLAQPFGWTKDAPLLKVPVTNRSPMYANYGPGALLEKETLLYDLLMTLGKTPVQDAELEATM